MGTFDKAEAPTDDIQQLIKDIHAVRKGDKTSYAKRAEESLRRAMSEEEWANHAESRLDDSEHHKYTEEAPPPLPELPEVVAPAQKKMQNTLAGKAAAAAAA